MPGIILPPRLLPTRDAFITDSSPNITGLVERIRSWSEALGFQQLGVTGTDLTLEESRLHEWLQAGYHGTMDYMSRHGSKRTRPDELVAGTLRVLSVRMDYQPVSDDDSLQVLRTSQRGYVARYTLGRDYHKILRRRLQQLADRIAEEVGPFGYRVFVDSAPVMEKPLAQKAGLGWIGKHTNLINKNAGSWFLLGEIYTDLPLPTDAPASDHCGRCTTCMEVCPTGAIVGPYQLDARRCISYLTIELKGAIPENLRAAIGNRIFGCDDCQLFCPWNKFAHPTKEPDFRPRHGLDAPALADLFAWTDTQWAEKTAGSAIRRAGYEGWLRNIAIALGNAEPCPEILRALQSRRDHPSALVREHVAWAIEEQGRKTAGYV
jgi:epoxyqueuosine reductase